MATTSLRTPTTTVRPPSTPVSASAVKPNCITFLSYLHRRRGQTALLPRRCRIHHSANTIVQLPHRSVEKFIVFASNGDAAEAAQTETQEPEQEVQESEQEENVDGAAAEDASDEGDNAAADETASFIATSLQLYRDALANNDDSKVAEIEISLKSIEEEKIELQRKVASLTEELSSERDRVLRISADFDNFRKRTERERLSLVKNAQGEVVEKLLSILDNFERAKMQIKVATEGEEKINNSYQSISKKFGEILGSLGVETVETVGKPFDPLLHEAIMREDSEEFEEGVVLEEYRKGFKLGDRLLRPSMVKVSAGPGPAKPETAEPKEEQNEVEEKSEEGTAETAGDEGTGEGGN
nr:protein GrpE isoform X1 [Nicotiana tomentosiformis]